MSDFHWRLARLEKKLIRAKQERFVINILLLVAALFLFLQLGLLPALSVIAVMAAADMHDLAEGDVKDLKKKVSQAQAITDAMVEETRQASRPVMTEGDRWLQPSGAGAFPAPDSHRDSSILETKED